MNSVAAADVPVHVPHEAAVPSNYLPKVLECSGVERATLSEMVSALGDQDRRVVVAGFTDYAKHLINLFPDRVVAVWDDEPVVGIRFRGVPVVAELPDDVTTVVGTRYADLYQLQQRILSRVGPPVRFVYPKQLDGHSTRVISTELQTPFYRRLLTDPTTEAATSRSMMGLDKIVFLVELLRSVAGRDGAVAEIGVWQGGSAYFLAAALEQMGVEKDLYLFDFFEEHDPRHPKGIMCADEMDRTFARFSGVQMVAGDIRESISSLSDRPLCFVHYDMGFQKSIVDVIAANLVPGGIILLDNYGHLAGRPGQFDSYFAERGLHVTRVPYTEQAIVFNNC